MHLGNSGGAEAAMLALFVKAGHEKHLCEPHSSWMLIWEEGFTMDINTAPGFVHVHRHFCQMRWRKGIGGDCELKEVGGGKPSGVNSVDLVLSGS